MAKQTILFLHGFASSARTTKATYFRRQLEALPEVEFHAVDLNPTPTDFAYMTTTGLINRLRQYVVDYRLERFSLIGSSYGGLIAMHYGHRFGGVEKMLLLAPALVWLFRGTSDEELEKWRKDGAAPVFHFAFQQDIPLRYDFYVDGLGYVDFIPPVSPVTILHGYRDPVVPVDYSRRYAARFPDRVHLVELDAAHDLNGHLDVLWQYVQSFLLVKEQGGE
jgi:pimeloyl-ACP methyl ester carboxylesterase